jgi:hypothetical protein
MKMLFGIVSGVIFLGIINYLLFALFGPALVKAMAPANMDEGGSAMALELLLFSLVNALLLGTSMAALALSEWDFKKALLTALLIGGSVGLFEFLVMAGTKWLVVLIGIGLMGFLSGLVFIFVRWLKQAFLLW